MVKLILKHLIYEQCINVLFDKIEHNFLYPDIIKDLNILDGTGPIRFSWSLKGKDNNYAFYVSNVRNDHNDDYYD